MTPAQIINVVSRGGRLTVNSKDQWAIQKRDKSGRWVTVRLVPTPAAEQAQAIINSKKEAP